MTDAELRAAAEMVVATGTHKDWFDTIDAGAVAVASAYLAEHPADEHELWTAEWLKAVGFDGDMSKNGPGMWLRGVRIHSDGRWSWCGQSWPFKAIQTRGDLRRICAALNIPLTEPTS